MQHLFTIKNNTKIIYEIGRS